MVDRQSNAPDSSAPEPLSLKAFAASLYHAQRADNYFRFLKNFSEEDLASFVQGLLRQVGDAIDDSSTEALTRFVEQGQVAAYVPTQTATPFRPDFPDAPFAPMRRRCARPLWPSSAQERSTWTTRTRTIPPNSPMSRQCARRARLPSASRLCASFRRRHRKGACAPGMWPTTSARRRRTST
jgi:hypothetical protein